MRKFIILLSMTIFNSYGQRLPDYTSKNLVPEAEKSFYFEAIALDLKFQNLTECDSGNKWYFVDYFLAGKLDQDGGTTELYKLDSETPLFVLRAKGVDSFGVNIVDFKIHTNRKMTRVDKVEYIEYQIYSERVNIGTLESPNIVDQEAVTVIREDDCF
ncbi:MAG: hypothetical protein H6621_11905 [Halobacteriovoraceae bacterium]|nr:hypothetical protein [Halobacteriovoraceae bacterium]MCB9095765.1 hypothetical protein [Halobacteriovoraceae bacterium]